MVVLMGQLLWKVDYYSSSFYFCYFIINLLTLFIIASSQFLLLREFWWNIFIGTLFVYLHLLCSIIQSSIYNISILFFRKPSSYEFHCIHYWTRPWTNPHMFPAKWCLLSSIMVLPYACGMLNKTNYCDLRVIHKK
jgi:hypothetical protein